MTDDFEAIVRTTLQAQILRALKEAPEAIDAMVRAALEQPVDEYGGKPSYHNPKMPYLEYIVGHHIRFAAGEAVKAAVAERKPQIDAAVRKAISADALVDALVARILGAVSEDYRVNITFADGKG